MQCFGITDCGKRRGSNQDAFLMKIAGNLLIATVCDGMGGANGGNVASTMAVDIYTKKLAKYINSALNFVFCGEVPEFGKPCGRFPDIRLHDFINKSVDVANAEVFSKAESDSRLAGMGTTLTSCIITPDSVVTANIGDSRIYYENNGRIRLLTRDHSYVQSLVDEGKITPEEAAVHPNRNIILRALGVDERVSADICTYPYTEGRLLLCSDGLSGYYDEELFIAVLESRRSAEDKARLFVNYANECGGVDNVTAVVINL